MVSSILSVLGGGLGLSATSAGATTSLGSGAPASGAGGDPLGRGASSSGLETVWVPAAADGPAGQRETAFRFELNMIVVAEAPLVKVLSTLVPITETPVVKSARNDE
jgi:hypothetical protein